MNFYTPISMDCNIKTLGLRHVALHVKNLEACKKFYLDFFDMQVDWEPDSDNIYLTSGGQDNLALHRTNESLATGKLDHMGFLVETASMVYAYFERAKAMQVPIVKEPKLHRDGATSFYLKDPDGIVVQIIHLGK